MATLNQRPGIRARHLAVGQVAAAKLRSLFDAIWTELRAACAEPGHTEHVHQLRVATRRATAGLAAFHAVIPASRHEWFKKRLRRLRRAAGAARDLDVLASGVARNHAFPAPGRLVAMLATQRNAARTPIRTEFDVLVAIDWKSRVKRLLADIRPRRPRCDFRDFARRRLKPTIESFFEKADRRLRHEDDIHAVRIEGKKLRYALEIFAPALPGHGLARCQRSLEQLQETLGRFTDHASAANRFHSWARRTDPGPDRESLLALADDARRKAETGRKDFSKWWSPKRRRALRRRFEHALRRPTL